MIFKKVKSIGLENNWHRTADTVFGLYKNYFFSLGDGMGYKFISAKVPELDEPQAQELQAGLEQNKKILGFQEFTITAKEVYVKFSENLLPTKKRTLLQTLDFLVELFQSVGLSSADGCQGCSSPNNLSQYDFSGKGTRLCKGCAGQAEEALYEAEREDIRENRSYFGGFLGAMVFSLAGVVAWVLVAILFNMIASALGMVIAFFGIKGYEYFKGKWGPLTKWIMVGANILSVALANAATISAMLVMEGVPLEEIIPLFENEPAVREMFFQNLSTSYVLCALVWAWLIFGMSFQKPFIRLARPLNESLRQEVRPQVAS